MSTPFWVSDNDVINPLLHRFLDKLDKQHKNLMIKASEKELPSLFFSQDTDPDHLWDDLVKKLCHDHLIVETIRYDKSLPTTAPHYQNAKLYFNPDSEAQIREWLHRPSTVPYSEQWQAALNQSAHLLPVPDAFNTPIKSSDLNESEVIRGFVSAQQELTLAFEKRQKISLRTLSARCFLGDSKFLDQRRQFIEYAFPLAKKVLEPRAIMMSVYIPAKLETAIFVENFDSFRSTVNAVKTSKQANEVAVIYSAGYRSSANLIREIGNSQFVTINHATQGQYRAFADWWFSDRQDLPVWFWGDLDFEGMGILKSLRGKFHNANAFQAAYHAMLKFHADGVCHGYQSANKGKQTDPEQTGCNYSDQVLLPAIRATLSFTDQEVLSEADIRHAVERSFQQQF